MRRPRLPSCRVDERRPRRSAARRRRARRAPARAAGRARAPRLQLPLVLAAGRPRRVRGDRPGPLGALRGQPGAAAAGGRPASARAAPRRRRLLERVAARGRGARGSRAPAAAAPATPERPVAYFCAEFGVHRSLPVYSGGLGALAGDILKEASDRALPLVAVGLMYRQGYFRQRIDAGGWQHEYWVDTDPERLPAALVTGDDGAPLTVTVPIRGHEVTAQVWRVDVGRVPLFLLDTERPENDVAARWITSRLYVGDPDTRLAQYVLLGVGGVRALRGAGHRARASCTSTRATPRSRARGRARARRRRSVDGACAAARRGRSSPRTRRSRPATTPIPPRGRRGARRADRRRWASTRRRSSASAARTPTTTASRSASPSSRCARAAPPTASAAATARSRARCGTSSGPTAPSSDVPIGHVTNGVHVPTWVGAPMRELLDRHLGDGLARARRPTPRPGRRVDAIPDDELWAVRARAARRARRLRPRRASPTGSARDEPRDYVEAAAGAFDPDVLTIGFARRIATYKRLAPARPRPRARAGAARATTVRSSSCSPARRIRATTTASAWSSSCSRFKWAPEIGERVVFLDDYDLSSAARLVRGCDVWLNVPRPPLEASGTSGMKSAINGGLQLSVLDGWWAEAYDGDNGWALSGEVDADHARAGRARRRRAVPPARGGGRARVLRPRRGRPAARLARARARVAADDRAGVLGDADARGYVERFYGRVAERGCPDRWPGGWAFFRTALGTDGRYDFLIERSAAGDGGNVARSFCDALGQPEAAGRRRQRIRGRWRTSAFLCGGAPRGCGAAIRYFVCGSNRSSPVAGAFVLLERHMGSRTRAGVARWKSASVFLRRGARRAAPTASPDAARSFGAMRRVRFCLDLQASSTYPSPEAP